LVEEVDGGEDEGGQDDREDPSRGGSTTPAPRQEPVVFDPNSQEFLGTVSEYYRAEFTAGPLPSARELAGYNQVSPGLVDTIVGEWRTETAHRRRLEQHALSSRIGAQTRGQWFGLIVALVVIGAGVLLTLTGHSAAGLVGVISPLAGSLSTANTGSARSRPNHLAGLACSFEPPRACTGACTAT
jgi:uncharacterized membrane protein